MTQKNDHETESIERFLSRVKVASPCSESWDAMPGGERVRSCARCQHRVYNLSAMSAADAAKLVREAEGRLCVRFYRRADGTILTRDCPVGLRAVRRRIARATAGAFTALAFAWGGASLAARPRSEQPRLARWVLDRLDPQEQPPFPKTVPLSMAPPEPVPVPVMGDVIAAPEPPHAVMGEIAAPEPRVVMGKIAAVPQDSSFATPTDCPTPAPAGTPALVAPPDKPYLRGLESEMRNAPRTDPFAEHQRPPKKP
jgi:hypothetical protein